MVQPENSTVLTHVTQLFIHVIAMSFSDAWSLPLSLSAFVPYHNARSQTAQPRRRERGNMLPPFVRPCGQCHRHSMSVARLNKMNNFAKAPLYASKMNPKWNSLQPQWASKVRTYRRTVSRRTTRTSKFGSVSGSPNQHFDIFISGIATDVSWRTKRTTLNCICI